MSKVSEFVLILSCNIPVVYIICCNGRSSRTQPKNSFVISITQGNLMLLMITPPTRSHCSQYTV